MKKIKDGTMQQIQFNTEKIKDGTMKKIKDDTMEKSQMVL